MLSHYSSGRKNPVHAAQLDAAAIRHAEHVRGPALITHNNETKL